MKSMMKYDMLKKLLNDHIPVPELLFFDETEYNYYVENKELSETVRKKVENFILGIKDVNRLPLVSIRCETKTKVPYENRAPISVVNVGIEYLSSTDEYRDIKENIFPTAYESYVDRAKCYVKSTIGKKYVSTLEEICFFIILVYEKMINTEYSGNKGIIIQRMVLGNYDEKSGTGICCNYPGQVTEETYCKGIFIPGACGIPSVKGCWGIGEMSLEEFKCINPKAYDSLRKIFAFLETKYGANPYIEFTCEGEELYILQYEIRQRFVQKGK